MQEKALPLEGEGRDSCDVTRSGIDFALLEEFQRRYEIETTKDLQALKNKFSLEDKLKKLGSELYAARIIVQITEKLDLRVVDSEPFKALIDDWFKHYAQGHFHIRFGI